MKAGNEVSNEHTDCGLLPPIEDVRARAAHHVLVRDVVAVARTLQLAAAAGMDSETMAALSQLLEVVTERRDDSSRAQHRAGQL